MRNNEPPPCSNRGNRVLFCCKVKYTLVLLRNAIITGFLLWTMGGYSQVTDSVRYSYPKVNGPYIKSCFTDSRDYFAAPVHWKGKQWIVFGGVGATAAILYTQDEKIREGFLRQQDPEVDKVVKYGIEPWGSGKYTVPLVGALYIGGRLARNDRLSATSLSACKALAVSGILVQLGKQAVHRHRPWQDDPADKTNWDGPFSDIHYTSFPSGHSAMVWSVATVFASEYKKTIWVPVLAYSLASATSLSRVYNDKHWASDIFIGSAIGYFTGRFMWKRNRSVTLLPFHQSGGTSLYMCLDL